MKNPLSIIFSLWRLLSASLFKSKHKETTSLYYDPEPSYRHRKTGKQKITKHTHVQRVSGKTIIHKPEVRFSEVGHNKILSLHAKFIQRAGLTNSLRK